jgi:hypothetical protein
MSVTHRTIQRVALVSGIASSLLYAAMNAFIPMLWQGYSCASQTVSELSAIGAPTRPLWVALGIVYTLLLTVCGWGVWTAARGNRPLRVTGGVMVAYGIISLGWPFASMHLRGTAFTLTDTMHIVLATVTVLLMLLMMGFGAAAFGKRFRLYSIVTMVVLVAFGALTAKEAPRVAADLATPWVGVWERINIGGYLLWVVVLAITALRVGEAADGLTAQRAANTYRARIR